MDSNDDAGETHCNDGLCPLSSGISRRGTRCLLISIYPPPVLPAKLMPAPHTRVPAFP
jgi:hypothetical protein